MSSTEANYESGKELFIQDYVSVENLIPSNDTIKLDENVGMLVVCEYPEPVGHCIEWRQCDYEPSDYADWELVYYGADCRKRNKSESSSNRISPAIAFQLKKLQSFQISRSKQQITLVSKGGSISSCKFYFQKGNVLVFAGCLKSLTSVTQSKHDKKLFLVSDKNLEASFAHLEIFPDDLPDKHPSTWQRFQERPVESAMNAFAKLNINKLFYTDKDDVIHDRLSGSLHCEELLRPKEAEVGAVSLPARQLTCRVSALNPEQWAAFFDADGVIKEHEVVKKIIFMGGVEPTIRKDVWMFLLGVYPWESTTSEREKIKKAQTLDYNRMKMQWETITKEQEERFSDFKERKSLIEKDVSRTDRTMNFYADDNNRNLEQLHDILMTYVMFNFDLGYVQGMSDILSPIFFLIQDEVDSFWCFTAAVERMVNNFDVDQAGMKLQLHQLFQLLTSVDPDLAQHLQKQDSSNMFFCFRWLLVWFKREFDFNDIYILWETIWAQALCPNYHLLICIAILDSEKDHIIKNEYGFTEILKHVNELSNKIDLTITLQEAEAIFTQLANATGIPNATRSILGLPLEPEPESSEEADENPNHCEFRSTVNGNVHFCTDSEELEYEKSITQSFL